MHYQSIKVRPGRPEGDAIHLFTAGTRRNVKAMLPHLHQANVARRCGYYYIDYHAPSEKACRQVEGDLAAHFICGKTRAFATTRMRGASHVASGEPLVAPHRVVSIVSAFGRHLEENAVAVLDVGHVTSPPFELVTVRGERWPLSEPVRTLDLVARSATHREGEMRLSPAATL